MKNRLFKRRQLLSIYRSGGNEARLAIKEALGDEFALNPPSNRTYQDFLRRRRERTSGKITLRSRHIALSNMDMPHRETDPETADIMAYAALRVIVEALNEGWKPQFTKGEWRWYAWVRPRFS